MLSYQVRKLAKPCLSLRRNKDAAGQRYDRLFENKGDTAQIEQASAEYGSLLGQWRDAEDAIIEAPKRSRCDVIAHLKILADRARLDLEVADDIATLISQLKEWRQAEPVVWP